MSTTNKIRRSYKLVTVVDAGTVLRSVVIIDRVNRKTTDQVTVDCPSEEIATKIVTALRESGLTRLPDVNITIRP